MDWKEFFRPTKRKIGLTILFILIFNLVPIIPCLTGLTDGLVRQTAHFSLCTLSRPLGLWISMGHFYDYFGLQNGEWIGYLYAIGVSYLLSSMVMHFLQRPK